MPIKPTAEACLQNNLKIWTYRQLDWLDLLGWKPAEIENLTTVTIEREGIAEDLGGEPAEEGAE